MRKGNKARDERRFRAYIRLENRLLNRDLRVKPQTFGEAQEMVTLRMKVGHEIEQAKAR